ncbi:hypothetical protein Tco_1574013 [Tanacetum coccineum]
MRGGKWVFDSYDRNASDNKVVETDCKSRASVTSYARGKKLWLKSNEYEFEGIQSLLDNMVTKSVIEDIDYELRLTTQIGFVGELILSRSLCKVSSQHVSRSFECYYVEWDCTMVIELDCNWFKLRLIFLWVCSPYESTHDLFDVIRCNVEGRSLTRKKVLMQNMRLMFWGYRLRNGEVQPELKVKLDPEVQLMVID